MTLDPKSGLVFVPTGSAVFDFYGANRLAITCSLIACSLSMRRRASAYGTSNSFVTDACGIATCRRLRPLSKYGRTARTIDALAQITKYGLCGLLDRRTGKPLVHYDEVDVPKSEVDGEMLSPKQILPTEPGAVRAPAGHARNSDESNARSSRSGARTIQETQQRPAIQSAQLQRDGHFPRFRWRWRMGRRRLGTLRPVFSMSIRPRWRGYWAGAVLR